MGRPSFTPTDEQRSQVSAWVEESVSIEEMARRIGITSKTFRKTFAAELSGRSVETSVKTEVLPPVPTFQPTAEHRQSVLIMAGAHGDEDRMARALGITVAQLKQYFADELRDGPAHGWRKLAEAAYNGTVAGSAAHLKIWSILNMQETKAVELQPAANEMRGKKEQARDAAQSAARAGGRFAPPPAPKLVVDNSA